MIFCVIQPVLSFVATVSWRHISVYEKLQGKQWGDPLTFCSICVQTPFTLTLRIWDIYILEGERLLPAMSYTILKLHKSKHVLLHTVVTAGVRLSNTKKKAYWCVFVFLRAPDEVVHGGPGGVSAGVTVQRFLLRGRLCDRAASGVHDGAQEGEAGTACTRYWYSVTHMDTLQLLSYREGTLLTDSWFCGGTTPTEPQRNIYEARFCSSYLLLFSNLIQNFRTDSYYNK